MTHTIELTEDDYRILLRLIRNHDRWHGLDYREAALYTRLVEAKREETV